MRRTALWLAPLALVLGLGAAVAFGGSDPLPPKPVDVYCTGCGTATSKDGCCWTPMNDCGGLWLNHPTFVRGPANVLIQGGAILVLPASSVARVSWETSVRGYRIEQWCGCASICFGNGSYPMRPPMSPGDVVTLVTGGDLYGWPTGYSPHKIPDIPEVSGFDPLDIPIGVPVGLPAGN
jgi:hypothetical protein